MGKLKLGTGITVPKEVLKDVTERLLGDRKALHAFSDSLAAGGIIASDLLVVCGAVNGLVHGSGLTMEGLCQLIQGKSGKGPGGKPKYSMEAIEDFLGVLMRLNEYIKE